MTVAVCKRCGIFISISWIPEGNPVALEDPEHWATAYSSCKVCGQLYCDGCSQLEPLCPECPGPLQPAPRDKQVAYIRKICREVNNYTGIEVVNQLWGFTTPGQTADGRIKELQETFTASEMQALCGAIYRMWIQYADFVSISWTGGYCWHSNTEPEIPVEFVRQLANLQSPEQPLASDDS